jgi:hypothetical protein
LSQPTAPSRTRVSAHRASDRPGPKWTSLSASCVLNPLVAASGKLRALEAGGGGADAETSGTGAGDAGADHAGEEVEGVGGQPAHPATATTNSMSPSTTTVDLRCKRRRCPSGTSPTRAGRGRSHQPTVRISWIGSRSEKHPEGLPVHIPENGSTMGASPGNWQCVNDLGGARPYHLRTRVTDRRGSVTQKCHPGPGGQSERLATGPAAWSSSPPEAWPPRRTSGRVRTRCAGATTSTTVMAATGPA